MRSARLSRWAPVRSWLALRSRPLVRVGLLAGLILAGILIYFAALWAAGVKVLRLLRR